MYPRRQSPGAFVPLLQKKRGKSRRYKIGSSLDGRTGESANTLPPRPELPPPPSLAEETKREEGVRTWREGVVGERGRPRGAVWGTGGGSGDMFFSLIFSTGSGSWEIQGDLILYKHRRPGSPWCLPTAQQTCLSRTTRMTGTTGTTLTSRTTHKHGATDGQDHLLCSSAS